MQGLALLMVFLVLVSAVYLFRNPDLKSKDSSRMGFISFMFLFLAAVFSGGCALVLTWAAADGCLIRKTTDGCIYGKLFLTFSIPALCFATLICHVNRVGDLARVQNNL